MDGGESILLVWVLELLATSLTLSKARRFKTLALPKALVPAGCIYFIKMAKNDTNKYFISANSIFALITGCYKSSVHILTLVIYCKIYCKFLFDTEQKTITKHNITNYSRNGRHRPRYTSSDAWGSHPPHGR